MKMKYEEFKKEVERILSEKGRPSSWSEIRNSSDKLDQRVPYHGYVQKLRGEIGLIEIKDRKTGRRTWALRRWFKRGEQTFLVPPEKLNVTLLCKAKEVFSKKYGPTHCLAGLDERWKWRRLYPLSAEVGDKIGKWDVIEVTVRDFLPEKNRPETVKIWPRKVNFIETIQIKDREKIITKTIETGEFLHTDAWRGKSIGLIKPKRARFFLKDDEIRCEFYCDQRRCRGHIMTVWNSEVHERRNFYELESGDLYFLLGTHKYHPHKWLLISVINLAEKKLPKLSNFSAS